MHFPGFCGCPCRYVCGVNRRVGALACIGFACWLVGCGGGEDGDLLSETGVRRCLAQAEIGPRAPDATASDWAGYAPIYVPDFTAQAADGTGVAIIIEGSDRRAEQTAAHVRSAFASLRGSQAGAPDRVIASRNAVAIFSRPQSAADRDAVRSCLAGTYGSGPGS
jgi:hypothetical protein